MHNQIGTMIIIRIHCFLVPHAIWFVCSTYLTFNNGTGKNKEGNNPIGTTPPWIYKASFKFVFFIYLENTRYSTNVFIPQPKAIYLLSKNLKTLLSNDL